MVHKITSSCPETLSACMRVRASVHACVRACVRACVHACVCACVFVHVCVRVCACVCACVYIYVYAIVNMWECINSHDIVLIQNKIPLTVYFV